MALLYAATVFLSAFLLFQVQPLIGKYILPWFGGTSAVWTTCMLFFQVVLLAGYAYAHLIASRLKPKLQGLLHGGLLVAAFLTLPIIPSDAWKPGPESEPTLRILLLLGVTVGFPYLLLASTGPLVQRWFSLTFPGRSPYRLYALSNVGSLLALLSYPLAFERFFELPAQAWVWSAGYVLFSVLCGYGAWRQAQLSPAEEAIEEEELAAEENVPRPSLGMIALWLLLAACGSLMLLAITNQLCQDVAVVPFLWVLPLGIYLLTFIIAFDSERWYSRAWFSLVLVFGIAAACVALVQGVNLQLPKQIGMYSLALFGCCMAMHGELAKSKPNPRYLTLFYLTVSAGGALGGFFVAVVAPLIFNGIYELHLGLVLTCVLMLVMAGRDQLRILRHGPEAGEAALGRVFVIGTGLTAVFGTGLVAYFLGLHALAPEGQILTQARNFYGVLKVREKDSFPIQELEMDEAIGKELLVSRPNPLHRYELIHGRIMHGLQFRGKERRLLPTTYYVPTSGGGRAILLHPAREEAGRQFRIGVIGLGTGTVAAYGEEGIYIGYYEINPLVVELAGEYFTFLEDARERGTEIDIFMGDARLVLERQLAEGQRMKFDVLIVDAFSSDSIPVHLLTEEAFAAYEQHLAEGGVLAVHVSNRYLDLQPVVRALAETYEYQPLLIYNQGENDAEEDELTEEGTVPEGANSATWVLVTRNEELISRLRDDSGYVAWGADDKAPLLWTDRYSNLYDLLSEREETQE